MLHDSSCSASHALFSDLFWFPLPPTLTDIFPAALTRASATKRLFMPAAMLSMGVAFAVVQLELVGVS